MDLMEREMTILHVATNGVGDDCEIARVTACAVIGGEIVVRTELDGLCGMPAGATRINGLPDSYLAWNGMPQDALLVAVEQTVMESFDTNLLLVNNAPFTLGAIGWTMSRVNILDVGVLDLIPQGVRGRVRTWHELCTAHRVRSTDPCASYLEILRALCDAHSDLRAAKPHDLMGAQVRAFRARAESYANWLRGVPERAHEADDVRTSWPV